MLSKQTQDQIRKEAKERYKKDDDFTPTAQSEFIDDMCESCYIAGAETWAIWKEKADCYEKALKEIVNRWKPLGEVECPSGIATKALESFNQNKVK